MAKVVRVTGAGDGGFEFGPYAEKTVVAQATMNVSFDVFIPAATFSGWHPNGSGSFLQFTNDGIFAYWDGANFVWWTGQSGDTPTVDVAADTWVAITGKYENVGGTMWQMTWRADGTLVVPVDTFDLVVNPGDSTDIFFGESLDTGTLGQTVFYLRNLAVTT